MLNKVKILFLVLAFTTMFLGGKCNKDQPDLDRQPPVETTTPDEDMDAGDADDSEEVTNPWDQQEDPVVEEAPDPTVQEVNESGVLKTVYFALDQDSLTSEARATLQQNANWLKANPAFNIVVEGHCDERGSIEYNLNLGERRAKTVRDYLTTLGVAENRIRIVTYGEERPANPNSTEAAYSENRRAETKAESKS